MGRRTLLLVAALVVAALGTFAVFLYAQNADNRAAEGTAQVKVLVAKTDIATGTTGSTASANGAFEEKQVPADTVVPGAISDAAPISNLVAVVPVFTGQQIIAAQWGTTVSTGGLPIPAGLVASSIQLGDPQRVAGFVSPGSDVAVLATVTGLPGTTGPVTRTLLPKASVIAVGPTTVVTKTTSSGEAANTEQIPTAILTLALTQHQAEQVRWAAENGQLSLVLLSKDSKVVPSQGVNITNLFR